MSVTECICVNMNGGRLTAHECPEHGAHSDFIKTARATPSDLGKPRLADKPRYDLLPTEALAQITHAFMFGAAKYKPRDWERGLPWSDYYAKIQRHMLAWWGGEECSPDSGLSHLAHAGADLMMILTWSARGQGVYDDRTE